MRAEPHLRLSTGERAGQQHLPEGDGAPREATRTLPTADAAADAAQQPLGKRRALKLLLRQFAELREYASYYAVARIDSAKAFVRSTVASMVVAALGFVAVAGLILMASWLVLSGLAEGLGTLFGAHAWMGALLTGVAALGSVGIGVLCVVAARRSNARKRMVEKHEARQACQRTRFGRDAHNRKPAPVARGE